MRLVTFTHPRLAIEPQVGVLQGDRVLVAKALLGEAAPIEMIGLLGRGPEGLTALRAAVERFSEEHRGAAAIPVETAVPVWEVTLLAPVPRPGSVRDFYAFEQHVTAAYAQRGRDVPKAWYQVPVYFYLHSGTVIGPDAPVTKPAGTNELDFEFEIAAVIGNGGIDIPVERAWEHIAGLTILNDWSARDLQRQEMSVGLGPAKGKDFATSLGPWLVTLDELQDRFDGARHDLEMVARINDEEVTQGNLKTLHWSFAEMIARASQDVALQPGDVIGSGTVGGGCILELGTEIHPWLEPGDEVELEVERLGRLRTKVGDRR